MAGKELYLAQLGPNIAQRLADKTYKKRRAAAIAVQMLVRELVTEFKENRIVEIIRMLREDLLLTTSANTRKGGLMALSAAAIALAEPPGSLAVYQRQILLAVLPSFADPDCTVRFAACEALYNIGKVSRAMMLPFFTRIFDIMCKLVADSDDLCRQGGGLIDRLFKDIITEQDVEIDLPQFVELFSLRIYVRNASVRKFLVSWLIVLQSVPGISFLPFLPKFLYGLLKIVDDPNKPIQDMSIEILTEIFEEITRVDDFNVRLLMPVLVKFVKEEAQTNRARKIAFQCIFDMVEADKAGALEFAAEVLNVVLPVLSTSVDNAIREVGVSINQTLRKTDFGEFESDVSLAAVPVAVPVADTGAFDLLGVLGVITAQLQSKSVSTRLASLRWILMLHHKIPLRMYQHSDLITGILLRSVSDAEDRVATLALECLAEISSCAGMEARASTKQCEYAAAFFDGFILKLLDSFNEHKKLLHVRGPFIVTNLGLLIGPERLCKALSEALQLQDDYEFAGRAAHELSRCVLTAPEFGLVRDKILNMPEAEDQQLFAVIYKGWSHSPISTLALCLLAEAYEHATHLLDRIADLEVTVNTYDEAGMLARIIDQPQFSKLRLQLLDSRKSAYLVKAMYGLLMLLPQSADYTHLRGKLTSVTRIAMAINHTLLMYTAVPPVPSPTGRFDAIDFKVLMTHFDQIQRARAVHAKLISRRDSRRERRWTDTRSQSPVRQTRSTLAPDSPFVIIKSPSRSVTPTAM